MRSKIIQKEITEAQYIAEVIVIRQANKQGVPISDNLWKGDYWQTMYRRQTFAANSLLKIFSIDVILNVLNKQKWITTIAYKGFTKLCKEESDRLAKQPKIIPKEYVDNSTCVPVKQQTKNLFDSIKDIENAEKRNFEEF